MKKNIIYIEFEDNKKILYGINKDLKKSLSLFIEEQYIKAAIKHTLYTLDIENEEYILIDRTTSQ